MPLSIKEAIVDLKEKEKEKCKKLLKNYNLNLDKLVCLHVRDHGYYNDANRRKYRNSDISNHIGLIEYLISKKYLVTQGHWYSREFNQSTTKHVAKLDLSHVVT